MKNRKTTIILLIVMILVLTGAAVMVLLQNPAGGFTKLITDNTQDTANKAEGQAVSENGIPLNVFGEEIKTPDGTLQYNKTIMAESGRLFRTGDVNYRFDLKKEEKNAADIIEIMDSCRNKSDVLFVQQPNRYNPKEDILPYGYTNEYEKKYDYWSEAVRKAGIPALDLRTANKGKNDFYYGDHHWKIETAFRCARLIERRLAKEYSDRFSYDSNINRKSNFENITRSGFIGEEALRSEELFMGPEMITFPVPKYVTDFDFYKYDDGKLLLHKRGDFRNALMDLERLDKEKTGKYNVSLFWAHNEAVIKNHSSGNNQKVLLISNSLGRSMAMYLSLGFKETRYIDPQQDRFNESIIAYIDNYRPDFVIVMYNQSVKTK